VTTTDASFDSSLAYALQLDAQDTLASFRSLFYIPRDQIYLDGNSLGLLCKPAEEAILQVLREWKELAIEGWTEGSVPWFTMAEELAARTAPLIGAQLDEVIVANSTTVNLHQVLATLYKPEDSRNRILTDALSFPSDLYAIRSHLILRGLDPESHMETVCSRDGYLLSEDDIVSAMENNVRLALLPAVVYTSGQLLDMEWLTREAHRRGIIVGFDCSHSIGAVPHEFDKWGVDFAVWCNYKYLNNGPGGTGGLYLNRRHLDKAPGLAGWFSSDKARQFDLPSTLFKADGAGSLQIGTPNILSMAPLIGSLNVTTEAGIEAIRGKSLALTAYMIRLADELLTEHGFKLVTPREDVRRGGHVALAHPEAMRICMALRKSGIVPDYRPPDIVRLAPVALYTSFAECREAVLRLKELVLQKRYEEFPLQRGVVT
jgi:kynureninase